MDIFAYKLAIPVETSFGLAISDEKMKNCIGSNFDPESYNDYLNKLNQYLYLANEEYGLWQKDQLGAKEKYKDSLFQIKSILSVIEIPQRYIPFQTYNFFNNLLGTFIKCANIQSRNISTYSSNDLDATIIKYSSSLLSLLSCFRDCREYLNNIELFQIIEGFLYGNNKPKMRKAPKIHVEYSNYLINTFANFAADKEFHDKFTPVMFSYALNEFYQSKSPEDYIVPLNFFINYFHYCHKDKDLSKAQHSNIFSFGEIIEILGLFPCSPNLEKIKISDEIKKQIHIKSSCIIYIIANLECLPIDEFLESGLHLFVKKYFLKYKFLMATVECFAIYYKEHFPKLQISLEDLYNGLNTIADDQDYLQISFLTIYNILKNCPNQNEMLSSDLIPKIIIFIANEFEKKEYSTKLYSLTLLCFIYSKMPTSFYMQNISIVFFLLDNCCLFISERDEVNNVIFNFLGVCHSFLENCGNINEFPALACAYNRCLEVLSNSEEYFNEAQINSLAPFDIPMN